ncbi:MAG: thioesterase family protein [Longimicrobiales bacterium]
MSEAPAASVTFRFWRDVEVRFRDLDSLGHVHHSLSLMYVEEARAAYWREVAGRATVGEIDYVIGEVRIRYHERIMYPGSVRVGVRVSRIGGKSIAMEFQIRSETDVLLVSGETAQIMFDFTAGTSAPVTDDLRSRLETYEAG